MLLRPLSNSFVNPSVPRTLYMLDTLKVQPSHQAGFRRDGHRLSPPLVAFDRCMEIPPEIC